MSTTLKRPGNPVPIVRSKKKLRQSLPKDYNNAKRVEDSPKVVRITFALLNNFTSLNFNRMRIGLGYGSLMVIPDSQIRKVTPWRRKYTGARKAIFVTIAHPQTRIMIVCEGRSLTQQIEWRTVSVSTIDAP